MTSDDPVIPVIDALNELGIPYMLVGSYSSNLHGIARTTIDADFVLELGEVSINDLARRIEPLYILDPQLGFETVTCHTRWRFQHRHSKFKLEMFLLVTDEFDRLRFERRQRWEVCGRVMWFQSPEDVVINKLRWARQKDEHDIRDVIDVQGNALDWPYVEKWATHFGRLELLEKLRSARE